MKQFLIVALALSGLTASAQTTGLLSRVAFGSGLDTDKPRPIWNAVESAQPQLFVLLGESIGTNSATATNCPVWAEQNEGNEARILGLPGKQVQIIRLNTRAARGPAGSGALLDAEQWSWFREQLRKPAQIRIVASGIPVVSEDHQGKKWMDWPRDRELLFDMINDTEADGILFISGDLHQAELSMIGDDVPYRLYDLTSSPMNRKADEPVPEINRYGISAVVRDNNFGLITIDWSQPDPAITLEIQDEKGAPRIRHGITLSSVQAETQAP